MRQLKTLREIVNHPLNRGKSVRAIARYVGWNLARRMIDVSFVTELTEGTKLLFSNRENYATLVYIQRLFDFESMLFLLHLLETDDLFLDVGANVGSYTVLASGTVGACTIAIEPVPLTFADLLRNVHLNLLHNRVETHQCGIGENAGTLRFSAGKGGLNHVLRDTDSEKSVSVPVRTIDELLAGRVPRAIKIDVEGYELFALRGAGKTLSNPDLVALIIELNGSGVRYGVRDEDVHAAIVDFGFSPCVYDPVTRILQVAPGITRSGLNTLYVRDNERVAMELRNAKPVSVAGRLI